MSDRRALLTDREREIVAGDADVSDSYRYQTISRVRARFDRLADDLAALEDHGDLATELRAIVCDAESGRERDVTPVEDTPDRSDSAPVGDDDGQDAALDDALEGWAPDTEATPRTARAQTRRTAEWLREIGEYRRAGEIKAALAADSTLAERTWWERHVQPGLRHLADVGLVEYTKNRGYRWAGDGTE